MKKFCLFVTTLTISTLLIFPSWAGQWQQNEVGWWYQNDDGSFPTDQWLEIDGKQYYFDSNGYMLANTTTPDGYQVGTDGTWIEADSSDAGSSVQKYSDEDIAFSALNTLYNSLKDPDSLKVNYIKCESISYKNGTGDHIEARCALIKYSATNSYGGRITDYYLLEVRDSGKIISRTDPLYSLSTDTLSSATNIVEMDTDSLLSKLKDNQNN